MPADPIMQTLQAATPLLWRNPHWRPFAEARADVGLTLADVQTAEARRQRFAPYLSAALPSTASIWAENRLWFLAAGALLRANRDDTLRAGLQKFLTKIAYRR